MTSRHRSRTASRFRLHAVLCALAGFVAVVAAACGGGGSARPTPTVAAPVLSPVPSGTVIDLGRAAKLFHDGDYEDALTIYSAAALYGTTEQVQAGLWEIARIQHGRGQHGDAAKNVSALRATNPPADLDRQALLLLGVSELAEANFDGARAALEAYLATNGAAWPYAQLFLAQVDQHDGNPKDAIDRIDLAIAAGLPPKSNFNALMALGQADEQAADSTAGVADYRRAADAATGPTDGGEALWYLADAATTGNDPETASDVLRELIVTYPSTQRAADSLGDPRLPPGALTPLERAMVAFYHQDTAMAIAALQPVADAGTEDAPRAQYYLGILSERLEDWEAAIEHYTAAIDSPDSEPELLAQSYWDRGTVLERIGLTSDAIDSYAAVAEAQASHPESADGLFLAGFLAYRLGRNRDALDHWERLINLPAGGPADAARAEFWAGIVSAENGDPSGATSYLMGASNAAPLDYYGMRAASLVSGEAELPDAPAVTVQTPNWARAESWLTGWAGPEIIPGAMALFASNAWLRAVEMFSAGFTDQADEQWTALLSDNAGKPWLEYRLLREISAFDRPFVTVRPAETLAETHAGAPPEILQLAYPLEYLDIVQEQATEYGYSPLLLLALVRQESLYDPSASSAADDTGLTQVIPATAEEIAQQLGETDFNHGDLLRPKVALRFGGYYLGSNLTVFEGALPPALAGYNAGPGTSSNWWDAAGADPDLFLETIDYAVTHTYVESVLQNYARYLYAYGFTDSPTLPL